MELGLKSSQSNVRIHWEIVRNILGCDLREACSGTYHLCRFDSKCPMCPLRSTCCHQSLGFQNEAVDPNTNKWRSISNFKTDVLLFLFNCLLFKFFSKPRGKRCQLPLNSKLYTSPWNIWRACHTEHVQTELFIPHPPPTPPLLFPVSVNTSQCKPKSVEPFPVPFSISIYFISKS